MNLNFHYNSSSSLWLPPLNESEMFSSDRWFLVTDGGLLPSISAGSTTKPPELGPIVMLAMDGLESNCLSENSRLLLNCWVLLKKNNFSLSSIFRLQKQFLALSTLLLYLLIITLITHLAPNLNGCIFISLFFCSNISNEFDHFTIQAIFNGSSTVYQALLGTRLGWVPNFYFGFFMLWSPSLYHSCESNGRKNKDSWKGQLRNNEKHVPSGQ